MASLSLAAALRKKMEKKATRPALGAATPMGVTHRVPQTLSLEATWEWVQGFPVEHLEGLVAWANRVAAATGLPPTMEGTPSSTLSMAMDKWAGISEAGTGLGGGGSDMMDVVAAASPPMDPYMTQTMDGLREAWEVMRSVERIVECTKKGAMLGDVVITDTGRPIRVTADGACLEAFLVQADAQKWCVRGTRLYKFDEALGVAVHLGSIGAVLYRVAMEKSAHLGRYLGDRSGAASALVKSLASGSHDRLPFLGIETHRLLFEDCCVTLTSMGLSSDVRVAGSRTLTPRAAVGVPLHGPPTSADHILAAMVPEEFKVVMGRVLGMLMMPPALRVLDRWRVVVVAVGSFLSGRVHPLEWVIRTFVGHGVTDTVQGDRVTSLQQPYLLEVRAPEGVLTSEQEVLVSVGLDLGMPVVVYAPFVPTGLTGCTQRRLACVVLPSVPGGMEDTTQPRDTVLGAALQVGLGLYNSTDRWILDLGTPLAGEVALPARANPADVLSAEDLCAEMVQACAGVKVIPGAKAPIGAVRAAFEAYQARRGLGDFARVPFATQHMVEGAARAAKLHQHLDTAGKVTWVSPSQAFLNLSVVTAPHP